MAYLQFSVEGAVEQGLEEGVEAAADGGLVHGCGSILYFS